ncbi:uncharacterized protein BP01DRAFT_356669 [Aspergillus saccharolyticus JOP 1030-1]|uniref:Pinin/SDK/MemA protein domain-containing protein n=1 Tax=Aspergillus saccharolyticus JOP 1030-1 TaxID=1450539 RepID=A0A318ZGY1_9EURO|nr:hypothetical protein BP01DRAFT_356669 [Aspergillus saccharolyticus JOP 1030-1]PYH45624.1 hypothetical protein BP01DRAFT_356669 [Aspergillus saccharolyticus JOP 1030-1]
MAEGTLASAVALPDPEDHLPAPTAAGLKRRQSSSATEPGEEPTTAAETAGATDSKRRRLSSSASTSHHQPLPEPDADANTDHHQPPVSDQTQDRPPSPEETRRAPRRPAPGRKEEERKRGQRLFGALLGTLSQSSSNTAAQRRRADIEKRQQDKLKLQDEEYGELKKKRWQERVERRKKYQRAYEEEAMRTRHDNILATAGFLKTKAEPVLYYKPWQLRAEEESIIDDQIKEAEETVARERADFDARWAARVQEEEKQKPEAAQDEAQEPTAVPEPEGQEPTSVPEENPVHAEHAGSKPDGEAQQTPQETTPAHDSTGSLGESHDDLHRAHDDDGGEVVEDQEDTVIY